MPAKSRKQYRLMAAVAGGKVKRKGLTKSVAKKFVKKTAAKKRRKWSRKR